MVSPLPIINFICSFTSMFPVSFLATNLAKTVSLLLSHGFAFAHHQLYLLFHINVSSRVRSEVHEIIKCPIAPFHVNFVFHADFIFLSSFRKSLFLFFNNFPFCSCWNTFLNWFFIIFRTGSIQTFYLHLLSYGKKAFHRLPLHSDLTKVEEVNNACEYFRLDSSHEDERMRMFVFV